MSRQTILLSALGLVLTIALWWMFIMSPQRERVAVLESDLAATQAEGVTLDGRISALEAVRGEASQIEASIATLRSVVPIGADIPSALRQIQAAADDAGVVIGQVTTGRPVAAVEGEDLHAISVGLAASGTYFQVVDFLRRLEDPRITVRGVNVTAVSLAPADYPTLNLTLGGFMYALIDTFEAPVPEAPAPEPTAPPTEDAFELEVVS